MTDFAGGDGTPENPYLVETATQVNEIRNYLDKSFKQIARISMYDDETLNNEGWTPIGTEENPFTGSYDGDGYYLGLEIYNEFNRAGFFGVTSNAELKNINLEIYHDLYQDSYAGGLVGHAIGGNITDCYCELYSYGKDYFGGLVGVSSSTITNCGTYGRIRTQINDHPVEYIGGIVGKNDGIIQNSYSTVEIENYQTATAARNAGGIAGVNTGTIQNCVFAENIYDNTITGTCHRIVATNTGTLTDNYAWSDSKILGSVVTGGTLTNEDGLDVATADFTTSWWENLGFLFDFHPWYYNTTDTYIGVPAIDIYCSLSRSPLSGISPVKVTLKFSSDSPPESVIYEIAYASQPDVWIALTSGVTATCSISEIGTHKIRATGTIGGRLYHTISWDIRVDESPFAGGDGTADNPFLVATAAQLSEVRNFDYASFRQIADIDLSGSNWTPISHFRGNFNGDCHRITGLTVNVTGNGGLVAILWGTIKNMTIINANVKGGTYTGILAGYINDTGVVQDCIITGTSSGGHITAVNTGTIINCIDWVPSVEFAGGNGTAEHPYRISTPYHLSIMKDSPHRYFMIVNDIDLTGQMVNRDPTSTEAYGYISSFVGKLDGMGCIISGLTAPLFQSIGDGDGENPTIVENIRVGDVNIIQPQNPIQVCIGAFVSYYNYNNVIIKNCSVESGYIAGDDTSGIISGFAGNPIQHYGNHPSQIINCFTHANITSGLVGCGFVTASDRSQISNCYTTGNVTAKSTFGFTSNGGRTDVPVGNIKNVYIKGSLRATSQNNPKMAGFSGSPGPYSTNFVVLCPSMVIDYPPPERVIPATIAITYCGTIGGMEPSIFFTGYHLPIHLDVPAEDGDLLVYGGKTITEEQSHTRSWWQNTVGFEFTDTNPDAPWTWDSQKQLPVIVIPRKPIPPLGGDKSTLQDWNFCGAHLEADRGLMWGYWGTKIGDQP